MKSPDTSAEASRRRTVSRNSEPPAHGSNLAILFIVTINRQLLLNKSYPMCRSPDHCPSSRRAVGKQRRDPPCLTPPECRENTLSATARPKEYAGEEEKTRRPLLCS